jgi:hypothetical protein
MAKARVTFGRGRDVMVGAGTGHRPARIHVPVGRCPRHTGPGPVGGSESVFFRLLASPGQYHSTVMATYSLCVYFKIIVRFGCRPAEGLISPLWSTSLSRESACHKPHHDPAGCLAVAVIGYGPRSASTSPQGSGSTTIDLHGIFSRCATTQRPRTLTSLSPIRADSFPPKY